MEVLIIPASPPRRQQPNRFQFLVRLREEINALLALPFLQMACKAINVGASELFARFQVWQAFEDGNHFLGQFVSLFLAGHRGEKWLTGMS